MEDADLTDTPISLSVFIRVLLSTPSSRASSYTRSFANSNLPRPDDPVPSLPAGSDRARESTYPFDSTRWWAADNARRLALRNLSQLSAEGFAGALAPRAIVDTAVALSRPDRSLRGPLSMLVQQGMTLSRSVP